MKKGIRVLLLTLLCAALFCVTAYADDAGGMFAISMSPTVTAVPQLADGTAAEAVTAEIPVGNAVLDYYDGAERIQLTIQMDSILSGSNYLLMVIKGSSAVPTTDTVVYVDQIKAESNTLSYNVYPISLEIGEVYHVYISTDARPELGLVEIGFFQYGKDQKVYSINFYDDDGETVLGTYGLNRGDLPAYDGENPTKEPDDQYCYEFDKWVPEITAVAGDANYTASYRQNAHVPGEPVEENRVDSSCTEAGSYDEVVTCTLCGKELSRETKEIPMKAHEYGEPAWNWDDPSAPKLVFTCSVGGETETVDASVTPEAGVTPGSTVYSATAEFLGTTYTDKYIDCPCDLAEHSLALSVGESAQIHVYNPYGPDDDKTVDGTLFVWESENTGIATVDAAGNVTGISAGTTQVHVTASDGSFDKSCEISVRANVSFTDVADPTQYFYDPVYWAVSQGITTGRTDTTFDPYGQCTRGHIVTFLWRAFGKPEPTTSESDNPFDDVKPSDGFYKAVLWAYENGITTGQTPTTFGPWNFCTRGQIVTFLWRAFGKPEPTTENNPFDDVKPSDGFCNAVLWAVENGITTGRNPTTFDPWATCTRGQAVTFIYRAYN